MTQIRPFKPSFPLANSSHSFIPRERLLPASSVDRLIVSNWWMAAGPASGATRAFADLGSGDAAKTEEASLALYAVRRGGTRRAPVSTNPPAAF